MKKFSVFMMTLLISVAAHAQRGGTVTREGANAATGYLGFSNTAVNVGADFEAAMSNDTGIGGYFFFLADEKESTVFIRSQVITFGASAKGHYRTGGFDMYAAPGFGIALVDHNHAVNGREEDSTTFGPSLRLGMLYDFTPQVGIGLEYGSFFNWFSNDIPGSSVEVANLAVRLKF